MNNSPEWRITNEFCRRSVELLGQAELKTGHCLGQLGSDYKFQWTPENERGSLPI